MLRLHPAASLGDVLLLILGVNACVMVVSLSTVAHVVSFWVVRSRVVIQCPRYCRCVRDGCCALVPICGDFVAASLCVFVGAVLPMFTRCSHSWLLDVGAVMLLFVLLNLVIGICCGQHWHVTRWIPTGSFVFVHVYVVERFLLFLFKCADCLSFCQAWYPT